jgi:hypothetical protein
VRNACKSSSRHKVFLKRLEMQESGRNLPILLAHCCGFASRDVSNAGKEILGLYRQGHDDSFLFSAVCHFPRSFILNICRMKVFAHHLWIYKALNGCFDNAVGLSLNIFLGYKNPIILTVHKACKIQSQDAATHRSLSDYLLPRPSKTNI